jgi:hypothetical protein
MAKYDTAFGKALSISLASTAISVDALTDGNVVDMNDVNDFEGLMLGLDCSAYTTGDISVAAEESDDNISFSAVAADDIVGDNTPLDAVGTILVSYVGKKRYVKPQVLSANSGAGTAQIIAVQSRARAKPLS